MSQRNNSTSSALAAGRSQSESSESTFTVLSPVDGLPAASFLAFSVDDALATAARAAKAQTDWANLPFPERRRMLLNAADILEREHEDVARAFARETGATSDWAAMNVHEAAETLREAAGLTSTPTGQRLPGQDGSTNILSEREPAGVVLAIVPWNAPLVLAARSIAIALALGNAVLLRPSELAPQTAGAVIVDALHRAGVPADVVSCISTRPGDGRSVISALLDNSAVNRVVFIGSTPVGQKIAERAANRMIPGVFELGGKNATVIREDADLDEWIPKLALACFANSGQVCMCTERIIVHHSLRDELVRKLSDFANEMTVGDPAKVDTDLGPVIDDAAAERFDGYMVDAVEHGAQVTAGGLRDGRYVRPTVLTDVPTAAKVRFQETFLPLVHVTEFETDAEAIALANEGQFGLIASVVSKDEAAAVSLARQIRAGAVHVNGPSVGDEPHVPFGGLGLSGAGRLGGEESVRFFTTQRTYYIHNSK
ncbi:aldehyde dehydrogenase family protein [Gulosibacter molinativorax]|uniref:Aldehyde dehydrogenase n=1 Tax=Gulosibacter molinativorax TaxID=256821 RepID=A0ABT7CBP6_9MICO|nr:aldehyde dehydrogenase family protein [Gulosibacter molinativorax]MDJ1372622.1 aldehyde dehydrogenase [Gulosibacter molinativorax]